jgi:hypothetical protein
LIKCRQPKWASASGYFEQKCDDAVESMEDRQLSTPSKVDVMIPLGVGAVVLLSSDAQPSQTIDIRPKIKI